MLILFKRNKLIQIKNSSIKKQALPYYNITTTTNKFYYKKKLPRCKGSMPSSLGVSTLQPKAQRVCARPSRPSRAQMCTGVSPSLS